MLYVVEHAPTGDVLRIYDGMSEETVSALVQTGGNTFEFITEDDYNARMAARPPKVL